MIDSVTKIESQNENYEIIYKEYITDDLGNIVPFFKKESVNKPMLLAYIESKNAEIEKKRLEIQKMQEKIDAINNL